jgi:hypothetical protein
MASSYFYGLKMLQRFWGMADKLTFSNMKRIQPSERDIWRVTWTTHSPRSSWSADCHYAAACRPVCWRHRAPPRCRPAQSVESVRTVRLPVGPAPEAQHLSQYGTSDTRRHLTQVGAGTATAIYLSERDDIKLKESYRIVIRTVGTRLHNCKVL